MHRKTKVNKRRLSISITVFILLILTVTFLKDKIEDITSAREKKVTSIGSINIDWNEDANIKGYDNSIIVIKDKKITSYDFNNQKNWHRNIDAEQQNTYLGENGVYITNNNDGIVDKLGVNGKKLWTYKTQYPIYTIAEKQGYLFIYSKGDQDIRNVTVVDSEGKEVLSNDKNKEEILSANISQDNKKFMVTSLDNKSSELNNKLTYLDDSGNILWEKDLEQKLIYNILFLNSKKMILVEDKQIICIDDKGNIIWEKDISYNLKDIEVLDEEIYILYGNNNSYLEVLDDNGKTEYKKTFSQIYENIVSDKDGIIILGKTDIMGVKKEKINLKYRIKEEAKMIDRYKNNIFIFSNNKIDILEIVNQ